MAAKRKPNEKDYITNKVLLVFSISLLGVLGLMMLYRLLAYGSSYTMGSAVLSVALGIGVLAICAGVVMILLEHKNKEDMRFRILRGCNILLLGAVCTVCMLVVRLFGAESIKIFYVLLPALAVYYLIFHSYPREFFIIAIDCGVAAGLLFIVRTLLSTTNYQALAWGAAAVAVVLAIVQCFLVFYVKKHGCRGLVDGRMTDLFVSGNAHIMMLVTAALMAAVVVLGAVLGAQIAYYMIFAAFGYLFVTAVYYTVKLM